MPIDPSKVKWDDIDASQVQWDQPQDLPSELGAIPAGFNTLVPALAGLPSDTLRNLANLGIAGYGAGRQLVGQKFLGETPSQAASAAPELLGPQMLGSEHIASLINRGLSKAVPGTDVFSNPRPDSPLAQKLYLGSQIASGGLMAPAAGVGGMLKNVGKMAPSALGAVAGQTIAPDQPLAPVLGAMAPIAARIAIQQPKPIVKPEAITAAQEAGYTIPPTQARPSLVNRALEGWAGKISTAQAAAMKNVKKANAAAVKDLGLPEGTVLSRDLLDGIRRQEGAVYEQVKGIGNLKSDATYRNDLARVSGKSTSLTAEFPGLMDKGVNKVVNMMNKKEISAPAAVEAIKQLRSDSSKNYMSMNAKDQNLARAQKQLANSLEGLLERHVAKTIPSYKDAFSMARKKIAQTYTAEKALNDATGNISMRKLATELTKGKPLSGGMKEAAKFGQAFPMAAQDIRSSMPGVSPLDYAAAAIPAAASGQYGWLATLAARPAARSLILSKHYQKLMTTPSTPIDSRAILGSLIQGTK